VSEIDVIKGYLPNRITSKEPFLSWLNAEGAVLGTFNGNSDDVLAQGFVDTATWGLTLWESFLGITTDPSKSYDYRRSVIKAKIRGVGTVTVAMIQNVAESFSNGTVTVAESPSTYSFSITFVGVHGIPPNMDDLTAAIEDIKPAHLAFSYIYTYMAWAMHDGYNHTWAEWDAKNLTWDEFTVYKE
jgi:uncharacterized protein YmfQ (DUF2313 family)